MSEQIFFSTIKSDFEKKKKRFHKTQEKHNILKHTHI